MKIKIKKLNKNAVIPQYSTEDSAGMDLTATSKIYDEYGNVSYGTGLAIEIPKGYVGLLFPRSSNSKKDLLLSNSIGIIDSDYRGEIFLKYKPSGIFFNNDGLAPEGRLGTDEDYFDEIIFPDNKLLNIQEYDIGDRLGQLIIIPYPYIEFEETNELSDTKRGINGYGSTGK